MTSHPPPSAPSAVRYCVDIITAQGHRRVYSRAIATAEAAVVASGADPETLYLATLTKGTFVYSDGDTIYVAREAAPE